MCPQHLAVAVTVPLLPDSALVRAISSAVQKLENGERIHTTMRTGVRQRCGSTTNTDISKCSFIVLMYLTNQPYSLRYLDDRLCSKKFPAVFDRDWKCPLIFESGSLDGYQEDTTLSETEVDLQTLSDIIPNDANVCLIMTRRGSDGKPHHKYATC